MAMKLHHRRSRDMGQPLCIDMMGEEIAEEMHLSGELRRALVCRKEIPELIAKGARTGGLKSDDWCTSLDFDL
jgi:hypothetical protein